ncbi:MAG TPA: ferritin-like domain-containing protein, partial [Cellvibrio sp.]
MILPPVHAAARLLKPLLRAISANVWLRTDKCQWFRQAIVFVEVGMTLYAINGGQYVPSKKTFITTTAQPDIHHERRPPGHLIDWLNRILMEESQRVIRFRSHYYLTLAHPQKIASIFLIHSNEKLLHIHALALRIVQLGGVPAFSVENIVVRSYPGSSLDYALAKLIEENLQAERRALGSYRDLLHYLSD